MSKKPGFIAAAAATAAMALGGPVALAEAAPSTHPGGPPGGITIDLALIIHLGDGGLGLGGTRGLGLGSVTDLLADILGAGVPGVPGLPGLPTIPGIPTLPIPSLPGL